MSVAIYCLKDPTTNEIRYIGRTSKALKERLACHMNSRITPRNKARRLYWFKKLKENKLKPTIELIEFVNDWESSHTRERELIEKYRSKGHPLLNMIDLGPGLEKVEGRHLTVYDLNGNRLQRFINVAATASFIGVTTKHLENSLKRKDKAIKTFQIRDVDLDKIEKYKKTCFTLKRYKPISFLDVETNIKLNFNSRREAITFFDIKKSKLLRKNTK